MKFLIKTTYKTYGAKDVTHHNFKGGWLSLTNKRIISLTIGSDINHVRCCGNIIKELYVPPHLKSIWVDVHQNITNIKELMGTDIRIVYIDFTKHGSDVFGTTMLEIELLSNQLSRISATLAS